MPEPREGLSDDDQGRLQSAGGDMQAAGQTASALPAGEKSAADARGAVTEPTEETAGRAEVTLTQALDERPSPSAEILELCDRIRKAIRDKRPPDEDSLVDADPEAMAKAAGNELQSDVQGDAQRVQGEYDQMDEAPEGQPAQTPTDYETPEPAVAADGGDATQAAPEPTPEEDFSLDADVDEQAKAMDEAGMETEPAKLVEDGPIGEARGAQGELEESAAETPAELSARQAEAIATAETDMASLQAEALAALQASRAQTVGGTGTRQGQMVGSEEQMRAQAGQRMRQIFTDARTQVTTLLEPLSTNAMAKWDAGVAQYASAFKSSLAEVERIIDERHSGIGGFFNSMGDAVFGLPAPIVALYDKAEKTFGDDVCALITTISEEVNGVIAACEAIIANARKQIDGVVDSLPDELQEWAKGEATALNEELDTLQSEVQQTQKDFTRDLCDRAAGAVQEVREEVHAKREAAKGLIGRIADAITEFLEDPFRFIVNGLLSLAGIDPGAFWALVDKLGDVVQAIADDPIGFCSTFIGAVGDGFKQFFDNIVTHLGNGFFEWITGGLSTVGVQMPPDFSLGSIVTLCLQVMGLTWDRIRGVLAKHVGEENVELLEKAVEFIGTFMQQGFSGMFEMLKEHFDPSQLVDMVKDAAMQWLIEKVITQAAVKLVSMLNPAGAIVQAVMAIYDAITWLFDNAAKIFKVVEAIVNGAADLIAGNTAALAGKVELALAGMIAPAIDFVAELIGLGDLPGKIAGIIKDLQEWVLGVVDKAIGWVVKHVKGLLKKLGVGADEEEDEEGAEDDREVGDGEIGETIRFTADGERHRLWIDTSSGVEVMVASTPGSVRARIQRWNTQVQTDPDSLGDEAGEARGLLGRAADQLGVTLTEAREAVGTQERAEQGEQNQQAEAAATQADDETEAAERTLADILTRLFEIFGESPDEGTENYRARIEKARGSTVFEGVFTAAEWASHFEVTDQTARNDFNTGMQHGDIVPASGTAYRLGGLTREECMRIASRDLLRLGRRSPHLTASDTFGLAEIEAFCKSIDALKGDEELIKADFCRDLAGQMVAAKDITDLGDGRYNFGEVPAQRWLPRGWDGAKVRNQFYINGSGFSSMKARIRARDIARIEDAIKLVEAGDPQGMVAWASLRTHKIVDDRTYNPRKVYTAAEFDVDHIKPLAEHWCEGGNNCSWSERKRVAGGEGNLRLMLSSENRSKGANDHRYTSKMWVGTGFDGPGPGMEWATASERFDFSRES